MDRRLLPPTTAIDILSDDDISTFSPTPRRKPKPSAGGGSPPTLLVIDDDPTPQKPYPNPDRTPSFVADTPLSSDVSIVKCALKRSRSSGNDRPSSWIPDKFPGTSEYICLESDNESGDGSSRGNLERPGFNPGSLLVGCSKMNSSCSMSPCGMVTSSDKDHVEYCSPIRQAASPSNENDMEVTVRNIDHGSFNGCSGTNLVRSLEDSAQDEQTDEDAISQHPLQASRYNDEEGSMLEQVDKTVKQKGRRVSSNSNKDKQKNELAARKKRQREEKALILEVKKRKRQEEKLQKEAMKAEAAEQKKLEREKQKWEKGKFAIKSIVFVAEVDAKVVENGSIGDLDDILYSLSFVIATSDVLFFERSINSFSMGLCWLESTKGMLALGMMWSL